MTSVIGSGHMPRPTTPELQRSIFADRERDQIARLHLEDYPNVTISASGSWLEADTRKDDQS